MNRLAIWIARREVVIAGLRKSQPEMLHRVPRSAGTPATNVLQSALSTLPMEWHAADVRLVLSDGDVACADCFEVPFRSEGEIEGIAASLTEGRCAGETAEDLAIAVRRATQTAEGSRVYALAMTHAALDAMRSILKQALPRAQLSLVTAALPLLADLIDSEGSYVIDCRSAGETLAVQIAKRSGVRWLALPRDAGDDANQTAAALRLQLGAAEIVSETIPLRGSPACPAELAVLTAALQCHPARVMNLLSFARDARQAHAGRLRAGWLRTVVAAMLLLGASGVYFDAKARHAAEALSAVENKEKALWKEYFPEKTYVPGSLQTSMNKVLADHAKGQAANQFPSALGFWREVATHLPNPDQVGLSIESIQLSHDGGRLIGRVDKANDDVLKNASLLEAHLNRSKQVQAKGEFETREKEIVVRLRMDYQPLAEGAK